MSERPVIFVLNGPNLNLLGQREPEIYGSDTLDAIAARLTERADALGFDLDCRQTNHEGMLVDWLQEANAVGARAVIINPAAYSHTSVALHDAVRAIDVPVIEVHLSNPQAREEFRHHSFVGSAARATIAGFGPLGYELALEAAAKL
jgi:3-dehydroquinate dehydratase-2